MFLEKAGRFLFKSIPAPLFFSGIILLPICVVIFLFFQKQSVDAMQGDIVRTMAKAKTAFEKKERKERFLERHRQSDPRFLDTTLATLSFLSSEKERLLSLGSHPALVNRREVSSRIRFIEGEENRLRFQEEGVQIAKQYKEIIEKQKRPVEMDSDDLNRALALIEESQVTCDLRPQLIITDFSLHKKTTPLRNEVLEIKMDLLKREFQ